MRRVRGTRKKNGMKVGVVNEEKKKVEENEDTKKDSFYVNFIFFIFCGLGWQ